MSGFIALLAVIAGALLVACAPSSESESKSESERFAHPEALASSAWLAEHLDDPGVRVLDGRAMWGPGERAYAEGHIPGAVYVDVLNDLSDPAGAVQGLIPPQDDFEALMGRLGVDNGTTVVVYDDQGGTWMARLWWALVVVYDDQGGTWMARLWWALRYYGHDDVKVLDGGLRSWTLAGNPLEEGTNVPAPASFAAQVQPGLRATLDDVQRAIADGDVAVIDARSVADYLRGHIPTSLTIPAPDNLDPASHQLLPPDELAALWRDAGVDPEQRAITYCGGGYYAALNLFALYQLGNDDASLYDGSWLEWGSDPDLAVETGSGQTP